MYEAIFIYNGKSTIIFCQSKDSLNEVFEKFINKENIQDKTIVYYYNGNKINNSNEKVEELTNDRKFTILAFNDDDSQINSLKNDNDNIIAYKVDDEFRIRIFGKEFIEKNKNNINIKIKGERYQLKEYFSTTSYFNDILLVKIKGIENITNMGHIFNGCTSLLSLPGLSKWNTSNVTNMSYMFNGCSALSSLPDLSKWNTSNVTNMSFMFSGCSGITSLSDLSKWNTSKVINIEYIFDRCSSLSILPSISKWNTSNVTNMGGMLNRCLSLTSLPDISKWNTSSVTSMEYI